MNTFLIKVTVEVPYPRELEYRVTATGVATAVARALRLVRKDVPRKRLSHYRIIVQAL
jgi:hypothetical protein